jgi:hypothetical protein
MDERLPLGSPDAATLAMLPEKECARLQAGMGRQNARIEQLERALGQCGSACSCWR